MTAYANLLTARFRRKELIRTRAMQWLIVCGIASAAVAGVIGLRHTRLEAQRRELETMEAECEPLRKMQARTADARIRLAEIAYRQALLNKMPGDQPVLAALGIVSRSANQPVAWVQVRHFALNKTAPRQSSAKAAAPGDGPTRLLLQGMAADDLALAGFIVGLRDSGVFQMVQLKSSLRASIANRDAREYQIECEF